MKLTSGVFGKIYKWLYAIPFGLKGFGDVIQGKSDDSSGPRLTVMDEASDERVGEHLLKGEVTQSVEDLRWRTYKVDNESKKYEYVGNGNAVKHVEDKQENQGHHRFSMSNKLISSTLSEGMEGTVKPMIEITYKSFVRFKLEKYVTEFDVDCDESSSNYEIDLHFSKHANVDDSTSRIFINEIGKLASNLAAVKRSELLGEIETISFSTYKANNEDDFVIYTFSDGNECLGIDETSDKNEWIVRLMFKSCTRIPVDFAEKYKSENLSRKYESMELRKTPIDYKVYERKYHCSVCGKEIPSYDGDILSYEGIGIVCNDCLKAAIGNK